MYIKLTLYSKYRRIPYMGIFRSLFNNIHLVLIYFPLSILYTLKEKMFHKHLIFFTALYICMWVD